jgi:hypothetical protein
MKNESSQSLRKKISALKARHNDLSGALKQAEAAHAECQQRLVKTFTAEAQEKAASAFAGYSSLKAALEAVERELELRTAELDEVRAFEAQGSTRAKLKVALRQEREAEEAYRVSRVKSDQALVEHVGAQVDAHRRWKRLQIEIAGLYKELGERPPRSSPIHCPEALQFGHFVDLAAQQLLNQVSRPTKEEVRQRNRERSAREAAATAARITRLKWHPDMRPKQPIVEPPRVIKGGPRMRILGGVNDEDAA